MAKLIPNEQVQGTVQQHNQIGFAVRKAIENNIDIIAEEVSKKLPAQNKAFQVQAVNVTPVAVPQGATIPMNRVVLDESCGDALLNPDGSLTVGYGVWVVDWSVQDATTTGLVVDGAIISQAVAGEGDLIEIRNKTATVKVVAVTGAATLQATGTQASLRLVKLIEHQKKSLPLCK